MTKKFPSDQQDQYMVRFPGGMRDRLKDEAAKNGRSMNAEIVTRLEASLAGVLGPGTVEQIMAHTIGGLLVRPERPTEAHVWQLQNALEELRLMEAEQLREFVKLVMLEWREPDWAGLSFQELAEGAKKREVEALRARAHRIGYELIGQADKKQ